MRRFIFLLAIATLTFGQSKAFGERHADTLGVNVPDGLMIGEEPKTDTISTLPLFSESGTIGPKKIIMNDNEAFSELDQRGNVWKVLRSDGVDILLNVRKMKHYGKYYRIDLYIQNNTDSPLSYDFKGTELSTLKGPAKLFSSEKFLSRMKSRKVWSAIGINTATFCLAALTMAVLDSDCDDSFGEAFAKDMAAIAIEEASYVAMTLYNESEREDMARMVRESVGYIDNYEIKPGTAIEGYAFAKYDPKSDYLKISLPIGDKTYVYSWDTSSLKDINLKDE